MYYSNPCRFGKITNSQWSADHWCLIKSSFPLTFDILALTHMLHLNSLFLLINQGKVTNQSAFMSRGFVSSLFCQVFFSLFPFIYS